MNLTAQVKNPFRPLFSIFLFLIFISKIGLLFELVPFSLAAFGSFFWLCVFIFLLIKNKALRQILNGVVTGISRISHFNLCMILFFTLLFTKIIAVLVFRIDSVSLHPDINCYAVSAFELANEGVVNTFANYCYRSSHMFWFAAFLVPSIKLFGFNQIGLSIYLSVVSTITTIVLFDICTHIYSKEFSFLSFLAFSLLPSQILLPQYITHEQASLFWLSIAFWIFIKLKTQQAYLILVLKYMFIGLLLLFAIKVNPGGMVFLIATVIAFFIIVFQKKESNNKSVFICFLSLLLIMTLGSNYLHNFQLNHSNITKEYDPQENYIWILFVGSNVQTEGMWSEDDVALFSRIEKDEIPNVTKMDCLKSRYDSLLNNPRTMLRLVVRKFSNMWSAFSYPVMYSSETIPSAGLQSFYNSYIRNPAVLLEYIVTMLMVCWALACRMNTRNETLWGMILELSIMGHTLLLSITECNNKYMILAQPFFWIICLSTFGMPEVTKQNKT